MPARGFDSPTTLHDEANALPPFDRAFGTLMYPVLNLKPGRDKSLRARHPWIFSGAVAAPASAAAGETVLIRSADGEALALGSWSPASQIAARVWSFDPGAKIDAEFAGNAIRQAIARRPAGNAHGAERLVNSESDHFPGLIVDRYGDYLACQFLSAGAEYWRAAVVDALTAQCRPAGIHERSDTDSRRKEGLAPRAGLLSGAEPPARIEVNWAGMVLGADLRAGHKTGLYLDQHDNIAVIRALARDRDVLNCHAYTGAFSIAALQGGARSVLNIESSAALLEPLAANHAANGFEPERFAVSTADVPTELRRLRDAAVSFDMVLLDPPKFVASASQLERGSRAYKDINLLGLKLLRPGGVLITFSCSGHMTPDLFQKIVADAAVDARRDVRIADYLHQAGDHPVLTSFPQGRYLKGLVCIAD